MLKRNKNLPLHEQNGCSHNWIHNAGKQCEWDADFVYDEIGVKLGKHRKDSNNKCNMYICTMCGEEFWSSDRCLDIAYYRVKERKANAKNKR